jgi:hypothetical protein
MVHTQPTDEDGDEEGGDDEVEDEDDEEDSRGDLFIVTLRGDFPTGEKLRGWPLPWTWLRCCAQYPLENCSSAQLSYLHGSVGVFMLRVAGIGLRSLGPSMKVSLMPTQLVADLHGVYASVER